VATGSVTLPLKMAGLPVRALRAEVVAGPDAGRAHVAGGESLSIGSAEGNDLRLEDPTVSRYHVELRRRAEGILVIDHGSTNGTVAGAIRIERAVVAPGSEIVLGGSTIRIGEGEPVDVEIHREETLGRVRGHSMVMRALMARVERAARAATPVLLVGETGTGKELVAQALHDRGPRPDGPFVTVDCGSLPETLVASELFGHERGAFTGAERQRPGAFERANGGTLFLDEIGELAPALQPALLGVLERRRLRRVGGTHEIDVDVRIVSATNRDLRAAVNAGTFRLDLYHRVAVVVLQLPPLRERPEDLELLIDHFLAECGHERPAADVFGAESMTALRGYHWPGNVRELRNLVEATVAMGETPLLAEPGPGEAPATDPIGALLDRPYGEARAALLHAFEARYLGALVERCGGNVSLAARTARMNRSHLIDLLKRHRGGE
jgi:DNA-binding NtrC family response regulator